MENFDFRKPEAYKNVNSGSTVKKINIQNKMTWSSYFRSFF